ncbi:GNAT family N-acetyltransferase [Benzoatithermus flavus]|uniref:GNAT family N-acetyltransferase n=1 Tax=Benzoatithermus flavus TaxID=3108223 RepID=A0ABU8XYD8_9PROT
MKPSCERTLQARTVRSIGEIAADDWDRLVPPDNPFLSHAFLRILEASNSASARTGWQPCHLVVEDEGGLVAAAPLYAKSHSYGEYVFDHGWAEGYRRAGGRYYPKLQVAVPFTPVPGPRLLARDDAARIVLVRSLAALTDQLGLSSLHVTFCTEKDAASLREAGFLERRGIQFHWHNDGYGSFEDWLGRLRSAKRKMVRKEREQVCAAGITIETHHGADLDPALLDAFYPFYRATVDKRWGNAYLTRDFFRRLGTELKERVVLVVARHRGRMVAGALNLIGQETLYGRQWGCLEEFAFLHFEACYYQAIAFAIRHGLSRVEAGAQGIHKLHRGYAPVWTHSAHYLPDPAFRDAVARFLAAERRQQELEMEEYRSLLPYRHAP